MAVSNARLNSSLALGTYTCVLSNPSAVGGLSRFVSGNPSSLDAFSSYDKARGYPACLQTTGKPEAPSRCSSRTYRFLPSSGHTILEDATELSRDVLNPTNV